MRLMALSPKLGKRNIVLQFALRNISFKLKAIIFVTTANTPMLRSFPTFVRGVQSFRCKCNIFHCTLEINNVEDNFPQHKNAVESHISYKPLCISIAFFSTEDYVHNGSSKGSKTQREQINNARSPNNRKQQKEIGIYFPFTTTTYNMTEIFSLDSGTMFLVDYQEKNRQSESRTCSHIIRPLIDIPTHVKIIQPQTFDSSSHIHILYRIIHK